MKVINLDDIRHCVRVANISMNLADLLGLTKNKKDDLYLSCIFHDIGKAFLDQKILNKPGKLTTQEKNHIECHPVFGYQEVKQSGYSDSIAKAILYHHENFDGTGYPGKVKGAKIPLGARIIKIADCFDALTTDRPYRAALTEAQALQIMESEKPNYDPEVYQFFIHSLAQYKDLNKNIKWGELRWYNTLNSRG